jgi:hypothetical protein
VTPGGWTLDSRERSRSSFDDEAWFAIVIDDTTAQLHVGLTLDTTGFYRVTQCGAAACTE